MSATRTYSASQAAARRASGRGGATPLARPKARQWRLNWLWVRRFLKITALLGVVAGVLFAVRGWNPRAQLDQVMNRPIAGVSVESEFKFISQEDTQAIVAARLSKTFLELDMQGIKAALEANPWVDKVMISRAWPDKLVVQIQEQKPIARWGNAGFLNMRGDVIKVKNTDRLGGLPLFDADEHYAKEVMQQYLLVKNLTAPNNLVPEVLTLDNTLAWSIQFNTGLTIKLGREKALEKLQNIGKILRSDLAREVSNMQKIDMRYDNGFAVTWKEPPSPQASARLQARQGVTADPNSVQSSSAE